MWMPHRHTENATKTEPDPRAPLQAASAFLLIAAFALLFTGAVQACSPNARTPTLASTATADATLYRNNPHLSEMMAAEVSQKEAAPITFTAKTHLANRSSLRQHAHAAALTQGWYPVPVPRGHVNPPDIFIVPQQDLHILGSIEKDPLNRLQELSSAPPRHPSPGPLVTTRIKVDTFITPSGTSKALLAAGGVLFVVSFAATWILTHNPPQARRT